MATIINAIRISPTQVKLVLSNVVNGQSYTLHYTNLKDIDGSSISGSVSFIGFSTLKIESVTANSPTTIRVVFNNDMSNIGLTTDSNYIFTSPAGAPITVSNVTKVNSKTVDITISGEMLTGIDNYTLTVNNVQDEDGKAINPSFNSSTFDGLGIAPQVSSASQFDSTHIDVVFNEAVEQTSMETAGNYSITGDDTPVVSAAVKQDATTVRLTIPFVISGNYVVTVSNVTDLVGNVIDPAHDSANFVAGPFRGHPTLGTDLLAYYKLEGNVIDSHGANNGTAEKAITTTPGIILNAIVFDGNGAPADDVGVCQTLNLDQLLANYNSFSISMWTKLNNDGDLQILTSLANWLDDHFSVDTRFYFQQVSGDSGGITFTYIGSTGGSVVCASTFTAGSTTHWVLTVDYDSGTTDTTVTLYKNGALAQQSSGSIGTRVISTLPLLIGGLIRAGIQRMQQTNGWMDEIAVASRAWTGSEASDLYNSGSGLPY